METVKNKFIFIFGRLICFWVIVLFYLLCGSGYLLLGLTTTLVGAWLARTLFNRASAAKEDLVNSGLKISLSFFEKPFPFIFVMLLFIYRMFWAMWWCNVGTATVIFVALVFLVLLFVRTKDRA